MGAANMQNITAAGIANGMGMGLLLVAFLCSRSLTADRERKDVEKVRTMLWSCFFGCLADFIAIYANGQPGIVMRALICQRIYTCL